MSFYNKIKWVLGILVVFVIIMATNLIDRSNFNRVKDSVTSIYEDRLLVKGIIFDMNNYIHQKEIAFLLKDQEYFSIDNVVANQELAKLLDEFRQTKLIAKERQISGKLVTNLEQLKRAEDFKNEQSFFASNNYMRELERVKNHLSALSKLQIDEGKRQLSISQRAIDSVELFTQLEIYVLIILAVVIQVIIIYKPKEQ